MRELRPEGVEIEFGGREYRLLFTLNVVDEIQEHYDSGMFLVLKRLFPTKETEETENEFDRKRRDSDRVLRYILTTLINEDIDMQNEDCDEKHPHVDERYVGRRITGRNKVRIVEAVIQAFVGESGNETEEETEDPNMESGTA